MKELDLNFRQLTAEALPEFLQYFSQSLRSDFPHFKPDALKTYTALPYLTRMANCKYAFTVESEGALAGYILAGEVFGGIAYVNWLQVQPILRGKGVARKLLEHLIVNVEKDGAHALHLITREHLVEFYEKCGFKLIGVDSKGYFGNQDYIMHKYL